MTTIPHSPTVLRSEVPLANDVYRGIRLLYEPSFERSFLEANTLADLIRVTVPCVFVGFVTSLIVSTITSAAIGQERLQDGGTDVIRLLGIAAAGGYLLGSLMWSFRPCPRGVAAWQVAVGDCGERHNEARRQIDGELQRRLASTKARVRPARKANRSVVRVSLGTFACYISVFPFGTDLFVGWAMIHEPNFWNVLVRFLRSVLSGSAWFSREMRSYEAKAMREIVHDSTRRGVAVAANVVDIDVTDPATREYGADQRRGAVQFR